MIWRYKPKSVIPDLIGNPGSLHSNVLRSLVPMLCVGTQSKTLCVTRSGEERFVVILHHLDAAADGDIRAGYECGVVRGQQQHRPGDILGLADSP